VLYQVYPRSFADANGDGHGDLRGLIDRLDYLQWLGVDGVWLNPITPSPNADWGYDVSDYTDVHPDLGTLDDVDRLIAEAGRRGIRVILDFVPNHTSDRHPWFVDARSRREARHRTWYVWVDPRPDGGPPNNWVSVFGGPAWSMDGATGQYYLHNFLPQQPDLDWWSEEVREAFDEILRFWFERGVAGFRIDVAHAIVKDRALRDNLPVTPDDPARIRGLGQRQIYNMHRPEVHDVLRRWRRIADAYDPPRILIGETWEHDVSVLATYYGAQEDELHLAFNFPFALAHLDAVELRAVVEQTEAQIGLRGWPVWTASNHDIGRLMTRWCDGDERRARCALALLLTLRGTPFLYYGDELALPDGEVGREGIRDPVGIRGWPEERGRDGCRTPMPWDASDGGGFTEPGVRPWLPIGTPKDQTVAAQRDDPESVLSFVRRLIALRRDSADLRSGAYETLASPARTWAYRRGASTVVALNMSDARTTIESGGADVVLSSLGGTRERSSCGDVELAPWEAVVLRADRRQDSAPEAWV
jgi:alpha-glucosidase